MSKGFVKNQLKIVLFCSLRRNLSCLVENSAFNINRKMI